MQYLIAGIVFVAMLAPQPALALAMRISNISDFNLPTWYIGDPAISRYMDICIYGINIPALLSYAITISSSPSGYKVEHTQNAAWTIPYSLYWEDSVSGALGTQLTDGVTLGGQLNLNVVSSTCAIGGPNARLTIQMTQAAMIAARGGDYSGSITLLLSPN